MSAHKLPIDRQVRIGNDAVSVTAVESVTLTVPAERGSIGIARLFVGGLAARVGLGFEAMDELQLALESVLMAATAGGEGELTLDARIESGSMSIVVGPFDRDPLGLRPQSEGIALGRMIAALAAGTESYEQDGLRWLRLVARAAVPPDERRP